MTMLISIPDTPICAIPPYPYPYTWQPVKPKRDGYLLGMSIASFIGAVLVTLVGVGQLSDPFSYRTNANWGKVVRQPAI